MRTRVFCLVALIAAVSTGCASRDAPLQLLSGNELSYPAEARRQGIEGTVSVRYDVDAEGVVQNAQVVTATPPDLFDSAALKTVQGWRFRPRMQDGQPVAVRGLVSDISFRLSGADKYEKY
jgi:TonB family protein